MHARTHAHTHTHTHSYFADIVDDTYKHASVLHSMWTPQNLQDPRFTVTLRGKPPHELHIELMAYRNDFKKSNGLSIGFRIENKGGVEVFRSRRVAARNVWGETTLSQNISEVDIATKMFGRSSGNIRFSVVIRSSSPFRACVKDVKGSIGQCVPSHMSQIVPPKPPSLQTNSTTAVKQKDVIWEWEDSGGYVPYSKALSVKIEQAFRTHSPSVQIEPVRGKIYVVDLRGMKQTSSRGFHRSIRRRI
jgi:hypothetical protein